MLLHLTDDQQAFPAAALALRQPNGLLAFGGSLSVSRLLMAYQQGIFPWYGEHDPILWWSPDPRAIFSLESLHVSRSMRRFMATTALRVTINHDFPRVIRYCAETHAEAGCWIHADMQQAYTDLHRSGYAHSIEVWQQQQLVAGLYGVNVNGIFCAESMFQRHTNASKFALIQFARHYFAAGGTWVDAQIHNPHLHSLGAMSIPRQHYLQQLQQNQQQNHDVSADFWQPRQLIII
jgi:leucyl/phenylalanyl-tRNA--protein transferase